MLRILAKFCQIRNQPVQGTFFLSFFLFYDLKKGPSPYQFFHLEKKIPLNFGDVSFFAQGENPLISLGDSEIIFIMPFPLSLIWNGRVPKMLKFDIIKGTYIDLGGTTNGKGWVHSRSKTYFLVITN